MIIKTCRISGEKFEITSDDLDFYKKMEIISSEDYKKLKSREISDCVGLPTLCPEERQRRRLAWRNERKLYSRKCDLCEKKIISIYNKNKEFPVYCQDCWWSDKWDAKEISRDFDFSKPFFEQFEGLQKKVPKLCLVFENNENCDYTHLVGDSKNCYLIFGSIGCENCFYGTPYFSKDCIDSLAIQKGELCYECLDSDNLYESIYCQNCTNSNNLIFCYDVQGSHDCLACVGLRKSKYCILNKQYSKEEYKKITSSVDFCNPKSRENIINKFEKLKISSNHKFQNGTLNENSTGDYIFESKNCFNSFNCKECEDMNRVTQINKSRDVFDTDNGEYGELIYENSGYFRINNSSFCHWNWVNSNDLMYCSNCSQNVKHCFGCIGIRNAHYHILNKQYTKEEYFKLREKIITHMKKTGEWGEFFPIELSPFDYNETVAQEYFPLPDPTESGLKPDRQDFYQSPDLKFKYKWKDKISRDFRPATIDNIQDDIKDVDDNICKEILACEECGKNYQIQKMELKFYRKMNLPIPRKCPDCRHADRMKLRNPRTLFNRNCSDCQKEIKTTFSPDRPERVLCEDCYFKKTY